MNEPIPANVEINTGHALLDLIYHAEWVLRANGWHQTPQYTGAADLHAKLAHVLALNSIKPK